MILSGIIAGAIIVSVIYAFTGLTMFNAAQKTDVSADNLENADLTMLAYSVLRYIRDEDFLALSRTVHPEFGVVLSPQATINLSTDRRLSAQQVATLDTDTRVYVWGVRNGSGEPIMLTPSEYFAEFVPAAFYIDATVIGVNQIVRSGNALENITDVFPDVRFVDFHMPGEDPLEEFGWSSLRLGFEEYNGEFRLITIAYSTWTV